MLTRTIIVAVVAVLLAAGAAGAAITIETVTVGNPGNVADTTVMSTDGTSGYGAVDYTYNIGKYEVTAGQYCAFLNAVAATDPYGLYSPSMDTSATGCQITRHGASGNYTYDFSGRPGGTEADWANRPVNYVTWGDAARFANWLHNGQPTGSQTLSTTEDGAYYLNGATGWVAASRESDWKWAVTSEDEWYKAAYYNPSTGTYYDYPTSSNTAPGRDLADASGNNANYRTSAAGFVIGSPYYRTPVGEFQNSDSPYGTFDQGGNVWEWNESVIQRNWSYRGYRGGSFYGDGAGTELSSYRNYYDSRDGTGSVDVIGFRVVQVPEPATLSLLALGGLVMLRRRRAGK